MISELTNFACTFSCCRAQQKVTYPKVGVKCKDFESFEKGCRSSLKAGFQLPLQDVRHTVIVGNTLSVPAKPHVHGCISAAYRR